MIVALVLGISIAVGILAQAWKRRTGGSMWYLVCITAVVMMSTSAASPIYKCEDAKGGTVYRDEPCRDDQTRVIVSPPSTTTQQRNADIARRVEQISRQPLPTDYRAQIDRYLARTLLDPDSRRIEYIGQPYGSAVCGMVNARNRFGGYTGRQIFLALFAATGTLQSLDIFTTASLKNVKYTGDVATHVLPRCGVDL